MTELFPPFEPDNERKPRRFNGVPLRILIPNVVTLLSLCAGLTAIRLGLEGQLADAVISVLVAAVLDGLDGRIARLLKGTSRFGAELDSLADFVSFGVAPAILLYVFGLHNLKSIGWIIALLFACACALRLARFNVMIDDPGRPEWQKNFFVGIPAPAGALTGLLPIYLMELGFEPPPGFAVVEAVYLLFIAYLMISRIPTYAGKTFGSRIPREWVVPFFVIAIALVGLLVTYTFLFLASVTVMYIALIPFGVRRYRSLERSHAAERAEQALHQS
jgi:CDP-diacylglycerol---serine O-phosphatidyltransferase